MYLQIINFKPSMTYLNLLGGKYIRQGGYLLLTRQKTKDNDNLESCILNALQVHCLRVL